MKIFNILILSFFISSYSFGYSVPKDSLQSQIQQLKEQILILQNEIKNQKVELDVANKIIDNSNKIVEYSGWIGIGVTVLLLIFGFYSYSSFNSSKKEITELKDKAESRLTEAEKQFNDFINSPERINSLFEEMNFKNIEKEIDSAEEKVFIQGLRRAEILSKEKKEVISNRLKSKLFDPAFWMHFEEMFHFLKYYSLQDIREISIDYFYEKQGKIGIIELYNIIYTIFEKEPYLLEPIRFYAKIKDEHKSLTLSHFRSLLNKENLTQLIEKIFEDKKLIDTYSFQNEIDVESFTEIIAKKITKISTEDFYKFVPFLTFNKIIFEERFNQSPNLKYLDGYIINYMSDIRACKLLVNLIDINNPENWKQLLLMNIGGISKSERIQILRDKMNTIKLPSEDFFNIDLPLILQLNYGIEKEKGNYYYREKTLNTVAHYYPDSNKSITEVTHPILGIINVRDIE